MADTRMNQAEAGKEGRQTLARTEREGRGVQRWERSYGSPFDFFDRMTEEMDRAFGRLWRDFGSARRSALWQEPFGSSSRQSLWQPRVEAFQKGDRFVVRAELPGLKKDDVQVELTDESLTIHGERQDERQEERDGYYHSEREYGQFHRTIPLPEGVIGESAKASFSDGVLEVSMQAAPAEASRGRRLEIKEPTEQKK